MYVSVKSKTEQHKVDPGERVAFGIGNNWKLPSGNVDVEVVERNLQDLLGHRHVL
jgi:hypothetical protein